MRAETEALIRGTLQVALGLLAAASFGGWVVTLGILASGTGSMSEIAAAFWIITVLYGLLALAIGSALGRRQEMRGVAAAAIGSLLAWGILEFFYAAWQIGSPQMRAPLIMGVALAVVGAVIGTVRSADRRAIRIELEQEMRELEREDEDADQYEVDDCEERRGADSSQH